MLLISKFVSKRLNQRILAHIKGQTKLLGELILPCGQMPRLQTRLPPLVGLRPLPSFYSDEQEYLNIRIFEYSNKMALEYYSYSYLCHFPNTNIFGYSFVEFWTTEYIQIFVRKFSKIRIYLICSEPYFTIWLSIFNEKSKSRYNLSIKSIQCKILVRGNMSELF